MKGNHLPNNKLTPNNVGYHVKQKCLNNLSNVGER